MKFKFNNKYVRWGFTTFIVIVSSIIFYYLLFHGGKIFQGLQKIVNVSMPVIWGLILGYLLTPIVNFFDKYFGLICDYFKIKNCSKRKKIFRFISIIFTWVIVIAMSYFLISMMIKQIIPSIQTIIHDFDIYTNNLNDWLNKFLEDYPSAKTHIVNLIERYSNEIEIWLNGTVIPKSTEILKTLSLSVLGFLSVVWDFVIGFVISIYILSSKECFIGQGKKIVFGIFEVDTANEIIKSLRFTHNTFIGFISGKVVDSIIIGLLCFIGVSILDLPYPSLISVIIGVTNVIPFFGPYFGAIPSAILILLVDFTHPENFIYFIIFIIILQQLDGNIIGPKILGDSTGLSGFWVIFSITIFGGFFGVIGMIIGVPTFAVVFAIIKGFINKKLKAKNLTINTNEYIMVDSVDENGIFHDYVPVEKKKFQKNDLLIAKLIHYFKEKKNKKRRE